MLRGRGAYATKHAVPVLGDKYMFLAVWADFNMQGSAPIPHFPSKELTLSTDTTTYGQEP